MKKILIILAFALTKISFSQSLTNLIPADAAYVFSLNFGQLNMKSNQLSYTKFLSPFLTESYSYYANNSTCSFPAIADMLKNINDYGISGQSELYMFRTQFSGISGTMYLFNLSDVKLFESKILLGCVDSNILLIKNVYNANVYVAGTKAVCVKGNMGALFIKDFNYFDYYTPEPTPPVVVPNDSVKSDITENQENVNEKAVNDDLMTESEKEDLNKEKLEKERKKAEAIRIKNQNKAIMFFMECWLNLSQGNIRKNMEFMKLSEGHHDAYVFMNTMAMFSNKMLPFIYDRNQYDMISSDKNAARVLTKDLSASYAIDFDNGQAVVKIAGHYNKKVYPYIKKQYHTRQSKKVFKYINGPELLGYTSIAVDMKQAGKLYEDMLKEMADQVPANLKGAYFLPAMQLFYAFIDKEMLYNTFTGHNILACTGFQDVNMQYSTYEYDENFNSKEKVIDTLQKQPKMIMVSALGNKEYARKLFDIVGGFPVFQKVNNSLFVLRPDRRSDMAVYFALTPDALVITNDSVLIFNNLGGLPKSKQITGNERKFIRKHNLAIKINTTEMLNAVQDAYFKKGETLPVVAQMMTSLGDLIVYDDKPTVTGYSATAVLTLKDNSANSLYLLLKMMAMVK